MMFSIDQNCHSLWDVPAKLAVLAHRGRAVTHLIEDVDAAFTALGADVDDPPGQAHSPGAPAAAGTASGLRLARERFHHSGGADWGAALFYTEFLGRQPVEIRDWEPLTGLKTSALARQLDQSVDELYERFSPGGNWQLIGPSYVGDRRHHRIIGDLTAAETAPFIRGLLDLARADMRRAFPARASQQRLDDWFAAEQVRLGALLGELVAADGRLVDLYARWLPACLPTSAAGCVRIDLTSRAFSIRATSATSATSATAATATTTGSATAGAPQQRHELLNLFISRYAEAAGLYNAALAETGSRLRPLRIEEGELPMFAIFDHAGHKVRSGVFLERGALRIADRTFAVGQGGRLPLADLAAAGVHAIIGKAIVLVSQVRLGAGGQGAGAGEELALPYRGSLYMPAAHLLARGLAERGLLPGRLGPIIRIRLRLLDRLRDLDTPIALPDWLAEAVGSAEVPARRLGESWRELMAEAAGRLRSFRDADGRSAWQRAAFPAEFPRMEELDGRRRRLAAANPKDPELRAIWQELRTLERTILAGTVRRIDHDWQLAELDYYDSRGAILPWCIALGGELFYRQVIARAELCEEDSLRPTSHAQD